MVLILGDIHGKFSHIKWTIKHRHLRNTTIIQVGDFGVGYEPTVDDKNLEDLNKFLLEKNCTVYAIRGNHDDPSYFEGNHIFSNLKLMPDYSQEIIEGKKFLFCGGAISIDRKFSLSKMQMSASHGLNKPMYWWDEAFDLDLEELEKIRDVEIVITHTAPEWAFPQNKNGFGDFVTAFFFDDAELEADLLKERAAVSKFFQKLKENGNPIELHFYGHFHNTGRVEWQGIDHILVDQGEFKDLGRYLPENYTF
jgi:predicted phosphodiesterase